jgi:SAM-dependent methyltransferase
MSKHFIFDEPAATKFTQTRQDFLRKVLPKLKGQLSLHSALDVGCGVGYFSAFLYELGFDVRGIDGRECNVEEAKARIPWVTFQHANVEDPSVKKLGPKDLVLCLGLLYHLENPMEAVRNLHALTGKLLLLESMCIPEDKPYLWLSQEGAGEDQSLRSVAFYPTEGCLVKMLYRAGFPFVWRWTELPAHEDFHESPRRKRARTILLASRTSLDFPLLARAKEPVFDWDLWTKSLGRVSRRMTKLEHFAAKPWSEKAAALRKRLKRN